MPKQTHNCYILQGNWGSHGWEELGVADVKDRERFVKLKELLEWHQENTPGAMFRIILRAR